MARQATVDAEELNPQLLNQCGEGKHPAPDDVQVPEPRPDLGPQLVEAAKGDDAEKVVSVLGQGAPVDFTVRGSGRR